MTNLSYSEVTNLPPPTKVDKKQIFLVSFIFLLTGIVIGYFLNIFKTQPNLGNLFSETPPATTSADDDKGLFYLSSKDIKFSKSDKIIISKGYLEGYDLTIYENKLQKISLKDCVDKRDNLRSLDIKISLLENPDNLAVESFLEKKVNEGSQDIVEGPFQKARVGDIEVRWKDLTSHSRVLYLAKDDLVYSFSAYSNAFSDKETSQNQLNLLNLLLENIEFYDERDCLEERVTQKISEEILISKEFQNFCQSGETGTFNPGNRLPTRWGLDYAGPNDTRPSSGVGKWQIINGKLHISGTAISDGIFDNIRFYEYQGDVFAIPKGANCIMFIGSDSEKIEDFYENKYKKEICKN